MPRLQHRPHTASAPVPPMGTGEAPPASPSGEHIPAPMAHDDWLRCAMAHWLEADAPVAFARMGDGH